MKKRDIKDASKEIEESNTRVRNMPKLPGQIPDRYKLTHVEVFKSFQNNLAVEYNRKLNNIIQIINDY